MTEPVPASPHVIPSLQGRHVVLGVTGSIAAYKAADLASRLVQAGATVDVVMTRAATRFVTPLTFQALVHRPVVTDLFSLRSPTSIEHVGLAKRADVLLIAPATADTLARLASGRADDALTATALAARCPLVLAPAMEEGMYEHPATQANLALLVERGALVVEPEVGRLASGALGRGRLASAERIIGTVRWALGQRYGDLIGCRLVVTAGGTREPLDPVRVLTNRSSGKMGVAVAHAARDRGARVCLITAAAPPADDVGIEVVPVQTALEMYEAVGKAVQDADALIMAAAVADYRPRTTLEHKHKKARAPMDVSGREPSHGAGEEVAWTLELVRNPDILGEHRGSFLRVGFAAETEDLHANAQAKLAEKDLDWIVANDVTQPGSGFDVDTNQVTIYSRWGEFAPLPLKTKLEVAESLLDAMAPRLRARAAQRAGAGSP